MSDVCSSAIVYKFIYLFDKITSHLEFHRWQSTFKENHRIDAIFMYGQLQQISAITMMQEVGTKSPSLLNPSSNFHRQSLPGHISATAERGLESNLYTLLRSSRTLLPDMNLKRGEVRRTNDYIVKGTRWINVWEGCYLNEEKVAIQVLSAVYATPKTLKVHHPNIVVVVFNQLICRGSNWRRRFGEECSKRIKESTSFRYTGFVRATGNIRGCFVPQESMLVPTFTP